MDFLTILLYVCCGILLVNVLSIAFFGWQYRHNEPEHEPEHEHKILISHNGKNDEAFLHWDFDTELARVDGNLTNDGQDDSI